MPGPSSIRLPLLNAPGMQSSTYYPSYRSQGLHHSQSSFSLPHLLPPCYLSCLTPLSKSTPAVITADSSLKGLKKCHQDQTPFTSFHESTDISLLLLLLERQMFNNGWANHRTCSHPSIHHPTRWMMHHANEHQRKMASAAEAEAAMMPLQSFERFHVAIICNLFS